MIAPDESRRRLAEVQAGGRKVGESVRVLRVLLERLHELALSLFPPAHAHVAHSTTVEQPNLRAEITLRTS